MKAQSIGPSDLPGGSFDIEEEAWSIGEDFVIRLPSSSFTCRVDLQPLLSSQLLGRPSRLELVDAEDPAKACSRL